MEMPGEAQFRGNLLSRSIAAGKMRVSELDARLRNVLNLINHAIESGVEFDKEEKLVDDEKSRALLRKTACDAVVLLKNEDSFLPLGSRSLKKLAVIGPNAGYAAVSGGGSASLNASYAVSPLEGIKALAEPKGIDVKYALGVNTPKFLPLLDDILAPSKDGKQGISLEFFGEDPRQNKSAKAVWSTTSTTSIAMLVSLLYLNWLRPLLKSACLGGRHTVRYCAESLSFTCNLSDQGVSGRQMGFRSIGRVCDFSMNSTAG